MALRKKFLFTLHFLLFLPLGLASLHASQTTIPDDAPPSVQKQNAPQTAQTQPEVMYKKKPILTRIRVEGLVSLPEDTVLSKIPYHEGEEFNPLLSTLCIKNVYSLGAFTQVEVELDYNTPTKADLIIKVAEKTPLKEVLFVGNKHLKEKDIYKKIDFKKVTALEQADLKKYCTLLSELYAEKGFHFAQITPELKVENGKALVTFTVKEGPESRVQKVRFKGNKTFNDKRLRSLLFTREDWIFGIFDRSGLYLPMAIEQDRYTLENFYQSNGYLNAKVPDAQVEFDAQKKLITVTFVIEEGDKYTIGSVNVPGNEVFTEDELKAVVPIVPGQPYSKELIKISIERLRHLWGKHGYIYADIEPSIEPDKDNKTVALTFYCEPGNKIHVNKINIIGHEKTREKVIRRNITFEEGDQLTTAGMEISKAKVSQLGYFDLKEGVHWKINRLNDETADLDLLVKEVKTGRFEFKANYGGTPGKLQSTASGLSVQMTMLERNLFGSGIYAELMGRLGSDEKIYTLNIMQPWFCDRPIYVGCESYYSSSIYEEIKKVKNTIDEKRLGGAVKSGFIWQANTDIAVKFNAGFESVHNTRPIAEFSGNLSAQAEYQAILSQRFQPSKFFYIEQKCEQDTRNHHLHISNGHLWSLGSKFGIPALGDNVAFYKFDLDTHWYTTIIDPHKLILHLHGYLGLVTPFGNNRIPFRELYNIGGQASVRAWKFGQIGPMWYEGSQTEEGGWQGEPIGAQKAFFFNAELVFPITEDMSIKGCFFYDGGSGWDTPQQAMINSSRLKNNSFDYRSCIGIGLRLLNPQPIRVDWGFKLDKRPGETTSEVNFSTYYDF